MSAEILPSGHHPDWHALADRHGSPLLVLDCDVLRFQYRKLTEALPGVAMHYAIKALPHEAVIATLAEEGASFDIATTGEIRLLEQVGIRARGTIHTHPIKRDRDIRDALRFGCTTFVADNLAELDKLAPFRERVSILIRLSFPNTDAVVDLSRKFGCAPESLDAMLEAADARGLHVKGLSFHVGSQAGSSAAHVAAIRRCAHWFDERRPNARAPLSVMDIGGGFPVNYDGRTGEIDEFCAPIRTALAELPPHVRVIAEPGRYLAAPAMTAITSVIGKAERGDHTWYYLDDGVYGSFSGQIYDHASYPLIALDARGTPVPSVLAGPTCDSIDVVAEHIEIGEMQIGDRIVVPMMGAYTAASATQFNSLPTTPIHVLSPPATQGRRLPDLRAV